MSSTGRPVVGTWIPQTNASGHTYYKNSVTNEMRWDLPAEGGGGGVRGERLMGVGVEVGELR